MSDFREDIACIVKAGEIAKPTSTVKANYYPNIPEKVMKGIRKSISGDIGVNTVAAVFDFSLFENGTSGLVFTTSGVYYKDFLFKKIYFNYKDVKNVYYDGIYIKVDIGDKTYDISNVCLNESKVISLFERLKAYVTEQGLESKKSSGAIKKEKMPKDLYNQCNVIIHGASVACGAVGAGLAQLPCADTVPITTAQVGMIVALGQVFELNITDGVARGIITGMSGSFIGRGIVQVAFGWIPGAGNAINTATAAGLTEAIGWSAANQFYNQSLDNTIQYSYEGEVKGFKDASDVYEKKLRDQAKHFMEQKKVLEEEREELNSIINEYEIYIAENCNTKSVTVSLMEDEVKKLKKIRDDS